MSVAASLPFMIFAPADESGNSSPPTPQAIPFPPSFLTGEAFATLQRATQKHSQSTGSVRDEDLWHETVGDSRADSNMPTRLLQGTEGQAHLALAEGLSSIVGDPASIKRKVPRPPKHIREESKRIAHITHQMLASCTPMEDMKERLSRMMSPICRDQKNIDYTMSVLRAVCRDFNEILEMMVEGEEFAGAPASIKNGRAMRSSQYVPQSNHSEGDGNAGWHASPWAAMATTSWPSLPTRKHNGSIAVELGNVMVLLQ